MVIEWLTFEVAEYERDEWMAVEERTWSRYLEQRPGFVRKEKWVDRDDPGRVHAVIWWTDEALWQSIPHDDIVRVDAAMGAWFRDCTMRVFDVVREC